MKRTLADIVRETLAEGALGYDTKMLGNQLYVILDDVRRIEVCFSTTGYHEVYDAIFLKLVSKTNGELDRKLVKFNTIFTCMQDLTHPNRIGKHIWIDRGNYSWYGKPTKADIMAMQQVVTDYIALWK